MESTLFDRTVALVGLVVLSPFLLIVALIIKLTSPGPALFRQERVGKGGWPFRIYKFRTMTNAPQRKSGENGMQITVGDDARITPVGAVLRRFKLDEIPQLINVLAGEMRLVGPRPEVPKYVAHYTFEQRETLSVAPGITDVATLYYRNESEELAGHPDPEAYYLQVILPRKLELNRRYLKHRSFLGDLVVILLTALVAVSPGRGALWVRTSIERRYLSDETTDAPSPSRTDDMVRLPILLASLVIMGLVIRTVVRLLRGYRPPQKKLPQREPEVEDAEYREVDKENG